MGLSPAEVREFLLRNKNIDLQAENRIEQFAQQHVPLHVTLGDETHDKAVSFTSLTEEVRRLKKDNALLHARVTGLKNLRSYDIRTIESPNWDAIEQEVGNERQSNPKVNILTNSGFAYWNGAATLPLGWTATNAPTISQQPGRPGIGSDRVAARIASGGSAGSIARTIYIGASTVYRLAGWLKITAGATATITLTTNGATPAVMSFAVTDAGSTTIPNIGAASWWSFPRQYADVLVIETPSDATTLQVKLQVSANGTVDFCDFQLGQGINRDPEVWTSSYQDGSATFPSGGGTANTLPKWNGSGALVDSRIIDTGSKITLPGFVDPTGIGLTPSAANPGAADPLVATTLWANSGDSNKVYYGAALLVPAALPPSGAAGGVLSGTYPNPGFAVDMATQTELDDAVALRVPKTTTITPTLPLTGGGDLSANRTLDINNFGGDAGAGGTKGTVPAPAAGDAAAGKFLKASGAWAVPPDVDTGITQLTGDVTAGPGSGSQAATLAAGDASKLNSGILADARMPDLTGDVTTTEGAVATTIGAGKVTYAKIQDVSATDKLLGRSTIGAGSVEEIACTPFARTVLDDADAATVRATIGAGTSSVTLPIGEGDVTNLTTDLGNKQPIDATLTALAGLTIAADSLSIGTGADAFTQVTFGANTFPAKSSAGALIAKPITDAGLAMVAAADAAAETALLNLATTSVKGLAPVLSNVATEFLNGTGAYSVPAAGTGISQVTANFLASIHGI